MNKKDHQIWLDFKYEEYLFYQHIFSYEKQLKSQGKMVLDYVVHDSDEANKIFDDLFNEHKKLKKNLKSISIHIIIKIILFGVFTILYCMMIIIARLVYLSVI